MATNGLEPDDTFTSYDQVPWYRRQWFIILTLLFFIPAMIVLVLTGDVYAKATRRLREADPSVEVWRYSSGGRTTMIVAGVILWVVGVAQIFVSG